MTDDEKIPILRLCGQLITESIMRLSAEYSVELKHTAQERYHLLRLVASDILGLYGAQIDDESFEAVIMRTRKYRQELLIIKEAEQKKCDEFWERLGEK